MLLGGVFAANGTPQKLFATLSPAKAAHNARDLERWAHHFGVPLRMPEGHPLRTVEALRATIASGIDPAVVHGFYRAYWVEGRAPSDQQTMRDVLSAGGHDAERILEAIARPDVKEDLRRRTDEAIALGIFGAPTFVVGGRLYWGQDGDLLGLLVTLCVPRLRTGQEACRAHRRAARVAPHAAGRRLQGDRAGGRSASHVE
jgi:2-hydroxychromene-2-carboxylate isomerase